VPEGGLRLGQVITGVPSAADSDDPPAAGGSGPREIEYVIVFRSDGAVLLERGRGPHADVTLVTSFETAAAIARGEVAVGEMLSVGGLKVRGGVRRLVGSTALLAAVMEALAVAGDGPGPD